MESHIESKSYISFSETWKQLDKLKMANGTQLLIVATFALVIPFIFLDVLAYDGCDEGDFRCGDQCL